MTIERLLQMEAQISGIPRERLLEIDDELNRWEWPAELGEAPAGWESMSITDKRTHIRDWAELIGSKFSKKERLRYHHIHNLQSTEQQFDDWWDSENRKILLEIQGQLNRQVGRPFADGISIAAIVISLILLLLRLC